MRALLLSCCCLAVAALDPKGRQRVQPLAAEDKAAYTMLANDNADAASMLTAFLPRFSTGFFSAVHSA